MARQAHCGLTRGDESDMNLRGLGAGGAIERSAP